MYLVSQDKKNIILMDKVEYSGLFKQYNIIADLKNGETVYEVR